MLILSLNVYANAVKLNPAHLQLSLRQLLKTAHEAIYIVNITVQKTGDAAKLLVIQANSEIRYSVIRQGANALDFKLLTLTF